MNFRRIKQDELEMIALKWARGQDNPQLNLSNIDSFIEGFKILYSRLRSKFGDFLIEEGRYYQEQYAIDRSKALKKGGHPFTPQNESEFKSAVDFGKELERLGKFYKEAKLLP